jgi:hypothetical protein
MNGKVSKSPPFNCEGCENIRRLLEPGSDNQEKCLPLEGQQSFLESPLERLKVPQLSDYTELIW